MNNYIIINGVSSKTVNGLLIQSLPPISKPMIRTSIEEIDGRDGDIITKLGFSAYDKELSIGLHGDYNIDDIISFFNSEGTIVFSNEPDKYYNFTIIDQIDFEKLVRFRTATVIIHVQPFKYSIVEGTKTFDLSTANEITVRNNGNYAARPIMTITGEGNISVTLNNNQIFQIALGDLGSITIDTNQMEAYNDSGLQNRLVAGDYDNFILNVGANTILFTGDVTQVLITNMSRWI